MKTITVFLLFVLVGSSTFASPQDFQWVVQRQGDLLFVHWKDKELHSNSCGFTLERFEYIPKIGSLDLDVRRDLCNFDFMDRSQGMHVWKMPYYLLGGGELHLFLSGKQVGTIKLSSDEATLELKGGSQ